MVAKRVKTHSGRYEMARVLKWTLLFFLTGFLWSGCAGGGTEVEAPQVTLDVRSQESYQVGEDIIRIHITASDPQGLDLEFSMVNKPERASFQTYSTTAIFTWDPIASDVTGSEPRRLVFVVKNSRGVATERVVNVLIEPGNTRPRFTSSTSELYNPQSGLPLEFKVKVRDDDSPQVIITMPREQAPQGATFEQVDNYEGIFRWMPSPDQLQKRMHSVIFIADDDDNEPVEQKVTIIIQSEGTVPGPTPGGGSSGEGLSCGAEEGIEHQGIGAQRGAHDYMIEGQILDRSQAWDEVAVFWTMDDPLGGQLYFDASILEFDGKNFSGTIANPHLNPGESAVISYTICAYSSANDEEVLCAPQEYYYRFVAYAPDDNKCRNDGLGHTTPARAAEISYREWEEFRTCEGVENYHEFLLYEGESALVAISFGPGAQFDAQISFEGQPVELDIFDCAGLAMARLEGPGQVTARVAGDEFPYHITAYLEGPTCLGEQYEPDDTPAKANLIVDPIVDFTDVAICTAEDIDIYAAELVRGDNFLAILDFEHALGDLDMTLFAPSQVAQILQQGYGVAQGWSESDGEEIYYRAVESGFYYLVVDTADEPNEYTLHVEVECVDEDRFAGNHIIDEAELIEAESHFEGLKLCGGQSDWFALIHEGNSKGLWIGEITTEYGSILPVEAKIYDDQGQLLEEGQLFENRRVDFYFEPEPGELYFLEIRTNQPTLYELRLEDYS